MENLSGAPLLGRLLGKHSSLLGSFVQYDLEKFCSIGPIFKSVNFRPKSLSSFSSWKSPCWTHGPRHGPGANVIKLFTAVSCDFS